MGAKATRGARLAEAAKAKGGRAVANPMLAANEALGDPLLVSSVLPRASPMRGEAIGDPLLQGATD